MYQQQLPLAQQPQQQQTSLYATAPSPDVMPPYASSSFVSAPPYYAENGSTYSQSALPSYANPSSNDMFLQHQSSSLSDSMASLSLSSQIPFSNPAPQGSYMAPPVSAPSYDQTYQALPQQHPSATSLQPSSYAPPSSGSGSAYPVVPQPSYDPIAPHPSYDQLSSSLIPSYATNQHVFDQNLRDNNTSHNNQQMGFEPSVPRYGEKHQVMGLDQSIPRYHEKQQLSYDPTQSYEANLQGYDFNNYGAPQGQTSVFDQPVAYSASPQARDFDRPVYNQSSRYEPTYQEKPVLTDRMPYKGSYVDDDDLGLGDVYAYSGGNSEPYGARGTGSNQWGNRDSFKSSLTSSYGSYGEPKLPRAVPKVDNEDRNGGVQKYRVKLLSDYGSGNVSQDVLCQIGLDGVRMVSPSTNKTVRIYPLENITRWEINEPSVFTFWAKSAVDIEPRRIRLQSGSYTTNAILDSLTAACVQLSEMVDKDGPSDSRKASSNITDNVSDQASEKKKPAFVSWLTLKNKQTAPEEKDHWVPDEAVTKCSACASEFGAFLRRHHCRNCGDIFCDKCTNGRTPLTSDEDAPVVRVCDRCLAEVTQRLSNGKELNNRPPPVTRTHEDLARKLQEELEKNSRRSTVYSGSNSNNSSRSGSFRGSSQSWSSSDGSGKRTREVACPTCTVHLQVQVPSSGSITVECGVCQHPFLVSAN